MKQPPSLSLRLTAVLLAVAALSGALLSLYPTRRAEAGGEPASGSPRGGTAPVLRLYTNPGTTTPQIPLWAAERAGKLAGVFTLDTQLWKTTDHLQGVLLAGEGDAWIGHIDGFARARNRGAPVVLLAVTGWRKFALVSSDATITGFADFAQRSLPYAPFGCPSVDVLRAVMPDIAAAITFQPYEPKQLALKMMQGKESSALLPEPLVTSLLEKIAGSRVVANVEDEYARLNGGLARMPVAGIAIHAKVAARYPERTEHLLQAILGAAESLAKTPNQAPSVLPAEFAEFVPPATVRRSLERDLILALAARDVTEEIERYLRIVTPELFAEGKPLDPAFVWAAPGRAAPQPEPGGQAPAR